MNLHKQLQVTFKAILGFNPPPQKKNIGWGWPYNPGDMFGVMTDILSCCHDVNWCRNLVTFSYSVLCMLNIVIGTSKICFYFFNILTSCLGNTLREDYKFRHTFTKEISKFLKASPGQVVMLQPEKFRSKYEPSSHTLTIKVSPWISRSKSFI